jgi:hypothetical protein
MPKKTNKKKHFRFSWKYLFLAIAILLALLMITAQVLYDKFIWDRTAEHGTLKVTILIQSALEQLEDLKDTPKEGPNKSQLIEEARLLLPAETDNVRRLLYFHNPADSSTDGTGYTWNTPESVQITTKQLASVTRQRIMAGQDINEIFSYVPEAQACNRGFMLQFTESSDNGLKFSGTKQLKDGRTLYVYREPECKLYEDGMNELEAYLLQAQSY